MTLRADRVRLLLLAALSIGLPASTEAVTLLVNGVAPPQPVTAAPGTSVSVEVSGGPGNMLDWVGLYAVGAPNNQYLAYRYMNGQTGATLSFTMPNTYSTYEFRFLPNNGYTATATSTTVVLAPPTPPVITLGGGTPALTVPPGKHIAVTVTNAVPISWPPARP